MNQHIATFILTGIFVCIPNCVSLAGDFFTDVEKVKQFNPDGQKYEFTKAYITSLTYLKINEQRRDNLLKVMMSRQDDLRKADASMKELVQENANLRVAKHMLRRFSSSENSFILKVTDLFTRTCDALIENNNKEKNIVEQFYAYRISSEQTDEAQEEMKEALIAVIQERKRALKDLLKASMLVNKILISGATDDFGELVALGITEQERLKLLARLDEFIDEGYEEEIRAGQTHLEGSVAVIKEFLEDITWQTLDEMEKDG